MMCMPGIIIIIIVIILGKKAYWNLATTAN